VNCIRQFLFTTLLVCSHIKSIKKTKCLLTYSCSKALKIMRAGSRRKCLNGNLVQSWNWSISLIIIIIIYKESIQILIKEVLIMQQFIEHSTCSITLYLLILSLSSCGDVVSSPWITRVSCQQTYLSFLLEIFWKRERNILCYSFLKENVKTPSFLFPIGELGFWRIIFS